MHPHQDFRGKQSHGQQCNRQHLRWFGKSLPKCYRIRSHPEAKESKKKNWKFKKKDFKKYFNNGNWEYCRCVTSNIFRIVIPRTALKGIQKGIRRIHKELHTIAVFSSMETQRVHLVANTASSVNCVENCAPDHVWCNGVISLAMLNGSGPTERSWSNNKCRTKIGLCVCYSKLPYFHVFRFVPYPGLINYVLP